MRPGENHLIFQTKESIMRTIAVLLILIAIAASQPASLLRTAVSVLAQLFAR
jgi:hypothetical protein